MDPATQLVIDWCIQEVPGYKLDTHTVDMVSSGNFTMVLSYQPEGFTRDRIDKSMVEVITEIAAFANRRLVSAMLAGLHLGLEGMQRTQIQESRTKGPYQAGLQEGFQAAIDTITAVFDD